MSLTPFGTPPPSRAETRAYGQSLSRLHTDLRGRLAEIDATVDLQISKLSGVAAVTEAALYDDAHVWAVGAQLAQAVPYAASGLNLIATTATLAFAQIVHDTGRRLR